MTVLPLEPGTRRTPDALRAFLEICREAVRDERHAQLVSLSLEVEALDPLAVLESIFEPTERHFYVERPSEGWAIAGAEAVISFEAAGPGRFAACRKFADETLTHAVAVGDLESPFSGPHFFAAFSFSNEVEPGEPFPAASLFVPRWQVALAGERTVAVANLLVDADSDVQAMTDKVWRAHGKFEAFTYREPELPDLEPPSLAADSGSAAGYEEAVRRALGMISEGAFEKIVLARTKDLAAERPLHPLRLLNGLRQRYTDCYAFSVANGHGQSFIGASPERLLRVRGGRLLTEALAGSARRGQTASEDAAFAAALQRDEKELLEHRLVVDSIVRRLAEAGIKAEHPPKPGIRRLANVQHLHTPLEAALPSGFPFLDAAATLYPTPAVGGSPTEAAVPKIRALEGFPRGLYAGALGWLDAKGGGEFFVGLRSALVDGPRARLYAGAGVVRGSSPERELAETELKFRAMQDALLGAR